MSKKTPIIKRKNAYYHLGKTIRRQVNTIKEGEEAKDWKIIFRYGGLGLMVAAFFFREAAHFKEVLAFGVFLLAVSLMFKKK